MITRRDIYSEAHPTARGTVVVKTGYGFVHEAECDPVHAAAVKIEGERQVLERLYGDVRAQARKALGEMRRIILYRELLGPELFEQLADMLTPLIQAGEEPTSKPQPHPQPLPLANHDD